MTVDYLIRFDDFFARITILSAHSSCVRVSRFGAGQEVGRLAVKNDRHALVGFLPKGDYIL